MMNMYGGTILLVNLSEGKVSKEPTTSYSGDFLGGRGVNIKILYDEVPPETKPLDPASPLIFGVGPLCGTQVPASRVEVTARSPETGFLGSSNFGGYFGPELKFAGYDNIVISGKADKPVYLWIYNEQVEIRDASHLWGKDAYKTQDIIRSEVDPDAKVVCIGPAGENLVHFATLQHELAHGGGRMGMGCVMGSKNLKAIVVRGTKGITLANPERYLSIASEVQQVLAKHPGVQDRQKHGSSFKYARADRRDARDQGISDPVVAYDLVLKYQPTRAGCFGCLQQCKQLFPVRAKGGGAIYCCFYTRPFSRVRNPDIELMLECGLLAQRSGIDIISSMNMIAWLMELYENGIITAKDTDGIPMEWGSREAIMGMFKKIINREGFGDVLANGILPAAEKLGRRAKDYAPHMKGLPLYGETTPVDIIPLKGGALAMVMSSRGDDMRSRTGALEEGGDAEYQAFLYRELYGKKAAVEYLEAARQRVKSITGTQKGGLPDSYEGKPELVVYAEDVVTINDCLSICKICAEHYDYPFTAKYQAALFSAGTGVETNEDMLFKYAKRIRNLERAYCVREGMTRETDSLPKRYMDQPITYSRIDYQDIDNVHLVKESSVLESSKFEQMKDKYYALRGWDIATGIPTRETLKQTGLGDVAQDLGKRGKLPAESPQGQSKTGEH